MKFGISRMMFVSAGLFLTLAAVGIGIIVMSVISQPSLSSIPPLDETTIDRGTEKLPATAEYDYPLEPSKLADAQNAPFVYEEQPQVARLAAQGTPSELLAALQNVSSTEVANIRFGRNYTPAHAAITNKKHPSVLVVLKAAGVDIDAKDDDGRTALQHALNNDNVDATLTLITLGADLTIKNDAGLSPDEFCEKSLESLPKNPPYSACLVLLGVKNLLNR